MSLALVQSRGDHVALDVHVAYAQAVRPHRRGSREALGRIPWDWATKLSYMLFVGCSHEQVEKADCEVRG